MVTKLAENAAYLALCMTIAGQILSTQSVLTAQVVWLAANVVNIARDYVLDRPRADKVRDWALCGITGGIVIAITLF